MLFIFSPKGRWESCASWQTFAVTEHHTRSALKSAIVMVTVAHIDEKRPPHKYNKCEGHFHDSPPRTLVIRLVVQSPKSAWAR